MEPKRREPDGRGGTILLVDDSDVVREVIARMLRNGGFTVLAASGAEAAMSISRSNGGSIDLLLTDIAMPETSGIELADRLAKERPDLPILFMTGYAEEAVKGKGISGGNREWIVKPFPQERILARVRNILARR
ncbi:MAG: hypothetical protein OHK0028_20910 [Deltaproteobacteria bacterium]